MPDEHTTASLSGTSFAATVDSWAQEHNLWPERGPILVGVSGGPDSMVLLNVLHALFASARGRSSETVPLIAAHVNYGLRPGADDDEALVRSVCANLTPSVPVEVLRADVEGGDTGSKTSLQERAREARYAFFARQAEAHGADAVAVGHHRQDQAETLLLRLFRGAGPEALSGMRPKRRLRRQQDVYLIRPLLHVNATKIKKTATEHKIPWREDSSNTSGPYARATLRTLILPAIEAEFPGATGRIAHAATLLREVTDTTLRPERLAWQTRVIAEWQNHDDAGANWTPGTDLALSRLSGILLDAGGLQDAPRAWRERVILDAIRSVAPDAPQTTGIARSVADLLDAQTGRRVHVGSGIVWRERDGLRVVSSQAEPFEPVSICPGTTASTPEGTVSMRVFSPEGAAMDELPAEGENADPNTVCLDADALLGWTNTPRPEASARSLQPTRGALAVGWVVRRWQEGDRIQPLGMEGTKTVADVLTDAKVPPHIRERILVVDGPTGIAWVVGHRIHHRFRLRPSTRAGVELTVQPKDSASYMGEATAGIRQNQPST